MAPRPVVTGLSPKEGPPGTRVIIRGEFLGIRQSDLIGLSICGYDCLLSAEWKSPNKVVAHTGPAKGKGDIIITTISGGIGTSTVQFRAYHEMIGPMKESAVWVEESSTRSLAWGRRNMAPLSYINDDPLGLSIEGSEKKFLEDIREQFPDGCSDISLESFSPCCFLIEHHHATTFDDLKAGLSYIKRKVESQKEGQLSFLKSNTGSVLDQLDTLILIRTQILNTASEHPFLQTLERLIQSAISLSGEIFHIVLDRREKAESTRIALGTLNRHRFLFCLPNSIDKNAASGEYDLIINDCARAINLFGKTDSFIFRQVFNEVNSRVSIVREQLYQDLLKLPQSVDCQKKLIKTLNNLEFHQQIGSHISCDIKKVDVAWDAIMARAAYLQETFKTTYNEFAAKTASFEAKFSDINESTKSSIFVEEICNIIVSQLPDLWRLGQLYFAGDIRGNSDPNPGDFKNIVLEIIISMCRHLRNVLFCGFDQRDIRQSVPIIWPRNCSTLAISQFLSQLIQNLQNLRSAYCKFIQLDLPGEVLDIIKDFIVEVRLFCLSAYFKRATDNIKNLKEAESWCPVVEDFPGATSLPALFERIMVKTLEEVQTYIAPETREIDILTDNSEGHTEVSQRLYEMVDAFCRVIEVLAYQLNDEDTQTLAVSQLIGFPNTQKQNHFISYEAGMRWEQRILCCLANCLYFERLSFNKIQFQLSKLGYPSCNSIIQSGHDLVKQLFLNLLETYVEHKSDPLVGTIEPSMYLGQFQWDNVEYVETLRPYAQECNDNLVGVFFEILAISPLLLNSIMEPIVQTVAEEVARLMSCIHIFSKSGAIQANVDILFLSNALHTLSNATARIHFSEALEAIGHLSDEENITVQCILSKVKMSTTLQVACFSVDNQLLYIDKTK